MKSVERVESVCCGWKVECLEEQKAQKEDLFLRGRQIAYLIYDQFRVIGTHDSVENYTDLFTIVLRNDDIQEFDSKWDGVLLSVTKIPHDDILEGLYKLRIRESEKLKTVLELYGLETHQKKLGPDYHRLKAMVKRSIEEEIRNKNFGARDGNYEKNAVVKNQGTKQRVQRILGDCWQWEANGQCVKGNNCSFRHDMNKCGKSSPSNPSPNSFMRQNERKPTRTRSPRGKSPSGGMPRWPCKDYLRGTCNNSFCEKWHPPECLYYKTKSGCRFGECPFAHRQVDEQPTKRSKSNNDKSAVEHRHAEAHPACEVHEGYCTSYQKFKTKIPRSVTFVQVNLMSVAPTLQNLRIVHKKRHSGKSKVPAKQRGSWPKMCLN